MCLNAYRVKWHILNVNNYNEIMGNSSGRITKICQPEIYFIDIMQTSHVMVTYLALPTFANPPTIIL